MLNQTVDPVVSWDPFLRLTITFSSTEVLTSFCHLTLDNSLLDRSTKCEYSVNFTCTGSSKINLEFADTKLDKFHWY